MQEMQWQPQFPEMPIEATASPESGTQGQATKRQNPTTYKEKIEVKREEKVEVPRQKETKDFGEDCPLLEEICTSAYPTIEDGREGGPSLH
jgi:hypothetical protein